MNFSGIDFQITKIMNTLDINYINKLLTAIYSLIALYITIKIIFEGYKIMTGKTSAPATSLLNDALWWVIIIGVASNHAGWLDLVSSFINELKNLTGSGEDTYKKLDGIYKIIKELSWKLYELDKSHFVALMGFFALVTVWVGFLILALISVGILIVTNITLKLLIIIAPLMIIALLFDWFKQTFYNWLQLILSNLLTLVFVGILFDVITEVYKGYIDGMKLGDLANKSIAFTAIEIFIVSIVMTILIITAKVFAERLAGTSIEGDMNQALKKGWDSFTKPFRKK